MRRHQNRYHDRERRRPVVPLHCRESRHNPRATHHWLRSRGAAAMPFPGPTPCSPTLQNSLLETHRAVGARNLPRDLGAFARRFNQRFTPRSNPREINPRAPRCCGNDNAADAIPLPQIGRGSVASGICFVASLTHPVISPAAIALQKSDPIGPWTVGRRDPVVRAPDRTAAGQWSRHRRPRTTRSTATHPPPYQTWS